MRRNISFFLVFLVIGAFVKGQTPIVQTDKGKVAGYEKGELQIFKGVPFAAPPIGELRWKAPEESQSWNGILECKEFSASPMQSDPQPFRMWTEEFIAPPEPLSEDCLYLNIWAKNSKEKKPVFVWIYGGGFNSGSAACAIYDGEEYAKQDVVFVSLNYRVNIFGYLAHPDLSAENEQGISGNYGLLDQIEALKWVQRNIEAFGGDPNNVTICGQSAGSMSIHALVASSLAKGLFHKAIGQSGGLLGLNRALTLTDAEKKGADFIAKMDGKSISDLRKIPAKELCQQVQKLGGLGYAPLRDGVVLPMDLEGYFEKGQHSDVPFLGGWVTGDRQLFSAPNMSPEEYAEKVKTDFGDKSSDYLQLFPGGTKEEIQASMSKRNLINFAAMPVDLLSKYNKNKVYVYQYAHIPPDKPDFPNYGAFHTSEVPFALHTLHTWERPWREVDHKMEKLVSSYWINFIKTGTPNGKGLPNWNSYENGGIQIIDKETHFSKNLYQKEFSILNQ